MVLNLPEPQTLIYLALAFAAGLLAGALFHAAWRSRRWRALETELAIARSELKSQQTLAEERQQTMRLTETRLASAFADLASQKFDAHSESFLRLAKQTLGTHHERAKSDLTEKEQAIFQLVKPIRKALEKTHEQIGAIEKQRHETFGTISAQLKIMAENQEALQGQTRNLVTALRRPEVRGQWGELTLRRVVELAGMVEHCDFSEQAHSKTRNGAIRPDLIVRLPDQGTIVVDAKTPLDAYLEAVEAPDDKTRKAALQRHARKVADRVRELSSKAYWSEFDESPQFVVLFIPGEQFFSAAMDQNPALYDDALRQQIIIATPANLIAMLKTVAYGWRQLQLAENAEVVKRLAQELHDRLNTFTRHLGKVGKQLESSVKAYNSAVGSLESNVLPGARKFVELGVQPKENIEPLTDIGTAPRDTEDRSGKAATDTPSLTSIDVKNDGDGDCRDDSTPSH